MIGLLIVWSPAIVTHTHTLPSRFIFCFTCSDKKQEIGSSQQLFRVNRIINIHRKGELSSSFFCNSFRLSSPTIRVCSLRKSLRGVDGARAWWREFSIFYLSIHFYSTEMCLVERIFTCSDCQLFVSVAKYFRDQKVRQVWRKVKFLRPSADRPLQVAIYFGTNCFCQIIFKSKGHKEIKIGFNNTTCLLKAHHNLAAGTLFPASFSFWLVSFERDKKKSKKGRGTKVCN